MATVQEKKNAPLPTRLRKLVAEGKWTQKEIADKVGVKPQSISQYLDGTVNPSYSVLISIADLFNVSTDYLLGRTDVATNDINMAGAEKHLGLSPKAIAKLMSSGTIKNVINHILCSGTAGVYAEFAATIHDEVYTNKIMKTSWPSQIDVLRRSLLEEKINCLNGLTAVIFSEEDFLGNAPLGAELKNLPTTNIIKLSKIIANPEAFMKAVEESGFAEDDLIKLQEQMKILSEFVSNTEEK